MQRKEEGATCASGCRFGRVLLLKPTSESSLRQRPGLLSCSQGSQAQWAWYDRAVLSDSREVPETRQEDSPLDPLRLRPVQDRRLRRGPGWGSPVTELHVTLISRTPKE